MTSATPSSRAGSYRGWLLSLLAARPGRRLLHTAMIASLALNFGGPAVAAGRGEPGESAATQDPYANPAVQNALHQLGLDAPASLTSLAPDSGGQQFQVNSYTTSSQVRPGVAVDGDGDFAITWQSYGSAGNDNTAESIQAQLFYANGLPKGSQFQVNNFTTNQQLYPAIAMDSDGDFAIVWQSYGSPGNDNANYSIQARLFDANGLAQANQFQVNNYSTSSQSSPAIAMDNGGDFVVVWGSYGSPEDDSNSFSVQARRFDSAGAPAAGQFQVNSYTSAAQRYPSVAMDNDGDFVVIWQSYGSYGSDYDGYSIQARRFDSAGTPLDTPEFQVNAYSSFAQRLPVVAMDSDGDFVVAWMSYEGYGSDYFYGVQARRFDLTGTPLDTPEFQVNSYTSFVQAYPAVAMDDDGDFVVVWRSYGTSGDSNSSVQGQSFTKDGLPLWGEFQVNGYTTDGQDYPAVAMDANGDFIVAWQSVGSDDPGPAGPVDTDVSIQASQFDLGQSDFQVNSYSSSSQIRPAVALDSDGDFAIVWQSYGSPGNDDNYYSIQARLFDANGLAKGDQFQVNTFTTGEQRFPAIAMDSDGDFVVVWESYGSPGNDNDVYSVQARRFNSAGTPAGSQFQVNTYTSLFQRYPDVAMDSDGDFVVVWQSNSSADDDPYGFGIQGRRYNAAGTALDTPEFQVNSYTFGSQTFPAVARDNDGDFVVAWDSAYADNDTSYHSIQGQRFDSAGAAAGSQFEVNDYTTGEQRYPDVAMDGDGDFVVVWQSYDYVYSYYYSNRGGRYNLAAVDDDGYSIKARRYNSAGTALDATDVQVNSYTTGVQLHPAVSADSSGDFVVVWSSLGSYGSDNNLFSVQGQRYNSAGTTQGSEFQVNAYTSNSQSRPAVALDSDGDFVVAWQSNGLSFPPFAAPLAPEDDNNYGIAASRFTALAGPEPTAITLRESETGLPMGAAGGLLATLAAIGAAATAFWLRLRRAKG